LLRNDVKPDCNFCKCAANFRPFFCATTGWDIHQTPLFGRGEQYLIALEDPLKLKEISYIHAKADPSGELKHGSLALVGEDMPVVAVAPNNELLGKLKKTSK